MSKQQAYRRDIDGLRALAVTIIVAYHAFPSVAPGGFVGVDVFFVISGFLITRIIAGRADAGRFGWGDFYLRRARRILPALIIVALATAGLAAWIELPRQLQLSGAAMAASAVFAANLFFGAGLGYFAPGPQLNPFLHLWSLGVEEQFYLVWPALIAALSWRGVRRARPWLVVALLLLSLAFGQLLLSRGAANWAFFSLPSRAWEFLAGGALGLGLLKPLGARAASWAAAAGFLLVAASIALLNDRLPFPGLAAVPACLGTALLLWSGERQKPTMTAPLRAAPVVALGRVSYSFYLWHWPLLVLARDAVQGPLGAGARLALVIAALALAAITWAFVEQPWRRGPTEGAWPKLAAFVAASLAVSAVGGGLFISRGAPARLSPEARAAAALETQDINPLRHACFDHPGAIAPTGCRIGAAADATDYDVLVWGDSHADAVTPGVATWAQARGWSVREAAIGGCPPLTGVRLRIVNGPRRPDCERSSDEVLGEVAANPRLKLVVLMARWPLYRDQPPFYDPNSPRVDMTVDGQRDGPPNLGPPLARTLDAIHQRNPMTRVVVIGPVPELTITPPECLAQARHLRRPEAFCWSAPAGPPLARARPAELEIASALSDRPWAKLVLPSADLCDARICRAALDGRPTYFDDDHLSASGARRLVPGWLDEALAPGASSLVLQAVDRPAAPMPRREGLQALD